jgi:predicted transcriptional regulator
METRKAIKVIGMETYIDQKTGELKDMQVISIEDRDANFHKLWLYHLAEALDMIGNQKTKVMYHIMENLNSENLYIGTQRKIAERLDLSMNTVIITIKKLHEAGLIKTVQNGVYQVNPEVLFKGGKDKRLSVLIEYSRIDDEEEQPNEQMI